MCPTFRVLRAPADQALRLTAASVVLASALLFGACGGSGHDHASSSATVAGARVIDVNAKSFEFKPNEVTVKVDEPVTISLHSEDILHDFTVDQFKTHVAAEAGKTVKGGLKADKAGKYEIYCSVPGHKESGMKGTLTVE